MHIDQVIDQDHRMVVLTLTGQLSDEELLGLADRIEQTPSIAKHFSMLVDLRFADGLNLTTEGVQRLAARPLILSPDSRRAVVVPDSLVFGMARMYEQLRGEGAFRIFKDYDKARSWIETGIA